MGLAFMPQGAIASFDPYATEGRIWALAHTSIPVSPGVDLEVYSAFTAFFVSGEDTPVSFLAETCSNACTLQLEKVVAIKLALFNESGLNWGV